MLNKRVAHPASALLGLVFAVVSMAFAVQPLGAMAQTTATGQPASPQTAGSATVEFSDVWQYDPDASDSETVFLTHADLPGTAFFYAEISDPVADAEGALGEFTDGFFSEFGDGDHTVVDSGTVPTDTFWQLFSVSLEGVPFGVYASVNVSTIPGDVLVTVLLSPSGSFDLAVTSVQEGISVNGAGTTLTSFDPRAMPATLSGEGTTVQAGPSEASTPDTGSGRGGLTLPPLGDPTATPAGTTTTTAPGAAGSVADFQAADAPDTCDAIGWVVTSPDQIPASEADINFRAACVGGGAFVAFCGTVAGNDVVAPEAGTIWIRCDITARVDAGPMALNPLNFSLTDGAGNEYTVDFMALFGLSNASEFPEAAVPAGQTGGGTVAFAVPETATGPWVLNVSPASLQATGEQPGQLVVDGELQPFDVFGQ